MTTPTAQEPDRLAAFAVYNPNPIVEVGADGAILYQNPAATRLLQELGLGEAGIEAILPEQVGDLVGAVLASGQERRRLEREACGRWFGWSIYPLPGGERAHLYGSDVSAVKRAEAEQRQLQDQLIQAEKLASLGTLVSGVAHEINNPLYGILGTAETILDEEDRRTVEELARTIVDYAQHIATIVREFAHYARPAALGQETAVDLNQRLTDAVRMVRRGPHFGQVEVVTQFAPRAEILARPSEVQQVFVNLIGNAVQAMKGAGRLTLATRCEGDAVTVSVADTGSGIAPANLRRIFDPFFTTKDPGKGTGLGLSIVHQIVTKYRGRISVESEEGRGTTFHLHFPTLKSAVNT